MSSSIKFQHSVARIHAFVLMEHVHRQSIIWACALLAACLPFGQTLAAELKSAIPPERATAVLVSNRDVNRINCSKPIDDVVWSSEKPVKVTHRDENVFVKFLVARQGGSESYVTSSLDVHIVCSGEVYTLILQPKPIDSVTVRLGDTQRSDLVQTAKDWGSLALEDKVKRLTLLVYRNEIPTSFRRTAIQKEDPRHRLKLFENAVLSGQQEIIASGTGLKATEYLIHVSEDVQLDERDFLRSEFGDVVGLTIEPLVVKADGFARLIVIERSASRDNL